MASKRLSPLDEPPAAYSIAEDEEEVSGSEEEEGVSGSEEEEEDDDEAEDPKSKISALPSNHSADKKFPSKMNNPAAANSNPKPHSSSSGSETDSESGSDTEPDNTRRPTGASDSNIKSISFSKQATTVNKKRPGGGESEAKDDSKLAKKKKKKGPESDDELGTEEKKLAGDEKKILFQRIWSEEDEIVILKGMIDYTAKKGAVPSADMNAFYDFIKKSLHINVTKAQLADKVRRLKKKYENYASKSNKYNPTKPHELKAFELSKKIWGGEGPSGSNGKVSNKQKDNSRSLSLLKAELLEKMAVDGNPGLSESLTEVVELGESLAVVGLPEHFVKKGLDLVAGSEKAELEEKWKKLHIAELELYAKRTQLISEQANLVLDAYKKSSDQ